MLLSDTGRNIDFAIEGAACKVISTEDRTLQKFVSASRVRDQIGVCTLSQIVHVGLIDITRLIGIATIGTTKDTANLDSRANWHIHHRTTGDTLFITTAIGCTYPSAHQVDDSRGFVERSLVGIGICRCSFRRHHRAHTQTVVGTCTKHLGVGEFLHIVGNVDQHITMILSFVAITITWTSLSGTEDLFYRIVGIRVRSEINESIVQIGLGGNTTIFTCSHLICRIIHIIIVTKATAKDVSHPTLCVFHIGRSFLNLCLIGRIHHAADIITDATTEVCISQNFATQVVSAIDMISDPWEAATILVGSVILLLTSYIGLGMSEDIGITTTCKRVKDTPITKVDMGITGNHTFECTTIDELTLSHIGTVANCASCHTRKTWFTIQVDIGAVCLIIYIFSSFIKFSIFLLAADSPHLSTTEYLEHITLVQVDGGTTPNL